MSVFCSKKLTPPVRIGLRLKNEREARDWSIKIVSERTHIPEKYLLAIEDGRFCDLPPAQPYRLAYIRQYAEAMNLPVNPIINQFKKENGLGDIKQQHPHRSIRFSLFTSIPVITKNIIALSLIFLFVGYLIWQVKGILQPPRLEVYTPQEGFVTNSLSILVQGETEPECRLTVNGQEMPANENGRFEMNIDLTSGVNTITVSAIQKHGKTTTVTRHVVAKGH